MTAIAGRFAASQHISRISVFASTAITGGGSEAIITGGARSAAATVTRKHPHTWYADAYKSRNFIERRLKD